MTKNKIQIIFSAAILVIALISLINASGVASPYWADNSLKLNPGETAFVNLTLQNMVGSGDIIFEAKISSEKDIATIINGGSDMKYLVPFGKQDIPVAIKIEVPSDAKPGEIYKVNVLFNEIPASQGGMLHVTSSVSTSFPVEINGKVSKSSYLIWALIGAIVLVVSLIIIIGKKHKKSKK
jgi:hypothetical protein